MTFVVLRRILSVRRSTVREFTVQQIAEMLSTNEETVRRWIRSGRIRAESVASRRHGIKVHEDALEDFLSGNPKYARLYHRLLPNRELQEGHDILADSMSQFRMPKELGSDGKKRSEDAMSLFDLTSITEGAAGPVTDRLIAFLRNELDETRCRRHKLVEMIGQLQQEVLECEKREEICEMQLKNLYDKR